MRPGSRPLLHLLRAGLGCIAAVAWSCAAQAGTATTTGLGNPASADLNFAINIDKFVFFRLGNSAWPVEDPGVSGIAFNLTPSIPGGPTTPVAVNNAPANWSGGAPNFAVTPNGSTLPVEVRSNAGQISLRASVVLPLASGVNTIPFSEITIATSNPALPAPAIPNAGLGNTANVTPTSPDNFVTVRSATWTFSYANLTNRPAGAYTGQVVFTATSP